jgi:formamidase
MHTIRIDRGKRLCDEPDCGHNRYHPDIAPIVEIAEGEEIALETRDALDGQIGPQTTVADFANLDVGAVHPLTGPVFVKGAMPGDVLEIEFTDIIAQPAAFSAIMPGLGFLRDVMTEPFLVHWEIRDNWATSAQLPGVRIPGAPFMGVSAVAPSGAKLAEWTAREQRVIERGGLALPPDAAGAVPVGPCGMSGLRTLPPRENGGNFDVKQLTRGARLFLPVFKEGGLFSTGDGHFAQGDGEVCVTAVETGLVGTFRLTVRDDISLEWPRAETPTHMITMAFDPDLDDCVVIALRQMLDIVCARVGIDRYQAYTLLSVAADLRVTQVVNGNKGIHVMLDKRYLQPVTAARSAP